MHRKIGFTLIELLVVVSIIVVLVAMLMPSLETAVGQAQRAACMSNQRQVGVGITGYLNDYRRFYPYGAPAEPGQLDFPWDNDAQWKDASGQRNALPPQFQLRPYLGGSAKVFICPTDPNPPAYNWWVYRSQSPEADLKQTGSSYTFNEFILYAGAVLRDHAFRATDFVGPADTLPYMSEGTVVAHGWRWIASDRNDPARQWYDSQFERVKWSHLNSLNMLFVDQSVRSVNQWSAAEGGLRERVRSDPETERLPDPF